MGEGVKVAAKRKAKDESLYQSCITCKESHPSKSHYYNTPSNHYDNGKYPVCKNCLTKSLPISDPLDGKYIEAVRNLLCEINRPFMFDLWDNSINESKSRNMDFFGIYMKNISMIHNKLLTWRDSVFDKKNVNMPNNIQETKETEFIQPSLVSDIDSLEVRNREDAIRMVGYDPFILENESDKRVLYNRLVDFLDESTLEDSFKLPAVIEIVKIFSQLDKINAAIAILTFNLADLSNNIGSINSLMTAKEKMMKTALAIAKDNGVSVNHNNNKSKGAGTLSGIIKQLHEKGINSAEINVYDIETCEGMKQVAKISNKSIMEQLMLNENDYTEMIKDQRELILSLTEKTEFLEEENRILKVKLKFSGIEERKSVKCMDGEIL